MKTGTHSLPSIFKFNITLLATAITALALSGCAAAPMGALYAAQYIPGALGILAATHSYNNLGAISSECERIISASYSAGLSPAAASEIVRTAPECNGLVQGSTSQTTRSPSSAGLQGSTPQTRSSDPVVREVQALLKAKGYDPGPVDGLFGMRTRQAIVQYQQDMGLDETGRADAELLRTLR